MQLVTSLKNSRWKETLRKVERQTYKTERHRLTSLGIRICCVVVAGPAAVWNAGMKGGNICCENLSSMKKRSWQPHKNNLGMRSHCYTKLTTSPHVYHAQWIQLHVFRTAVVISLRGIGQNEHKLFMKLVSGYKFLPHYRGRHCHKIASDFRIGIFVLDSKSHKRVNFNSESVI